MKTPVARDVILGLAFTFSVLAAGCGYAGTYSGGGYGGGGGGGGMATDCSSTATGPAVTIDLRLGIAACNDKTYGSVAGFSLDNAHSQVIKIPVGSTVKFTNSDGVYSHSADLLGTGGFPASDTNPHAQSPGGTDISAANFSSGVLAPGSSSPVYAAGVKGTYYFGDSLYYASGVRSVLIVQ